MVLDKKAFTKAVETCLNEGKGKRKFSQSVDLAVNFRQVDFTKQDNRLNVEMLLPKAPKQVKVAIFADGDLAYNAKKVADRVIGASELDEIAKDKKKTKTLADEFVFLSDPKLMAAVGKGLGKIFGAKGKLPKPILPGANLADAVDRARRTVTIKTKGKALPVVHCIVGKESMPAEDIVENIMVVMEALTKKLSESQIADVYVKTTMGKPVKV